MRHNVVLGLLKKVSRSFYLSLRLLPAPMREAAGLAYLLARASDTIADNSDAAIEMRLNLLEDFESRLSRDSGDCSLNSWPAELILSVKDMGERELLTMTHRLVEWLQDLPAGEVVLIRQVMRTIISGQRGDLELFGAATADCPVVMGSSEDLDLYTYRVAGCVGEFWTRLGYETLGEKFSTSPLDSMLALGINYGKGLQCVNILRDLPRDLRAGRCYLPVHDPRNRERLLNEHQLQCERAKSLVNQGLEYASLLEGRRTRMASVLPAMLAQETLDLLTGVDWPKLEAGVKITRSRVYANLLSALIY